MRINKLMVDLGLARTGGEATRLVKQGAVLVGGCERDCHWINTGKCTCGGWKKETDPAKTVPNGSVIKVGTGHWRLLPRLDGQRGFEQVRGVARA